MGSSFKWKFTLVPKILLEIEATSRKTLLVEMSVTGPRDGLEPQGTDRHPGALGGVVTLGACAGQLGSRCYCCNENFFRL